MEVYLKRLEDELRLRNYSPKTIKSYVGCVAEYLRIKQNNFDSVDIDFIKQYLLSKVNKKMSSQTINQSLQAINFFCWNVLKFHSKIDVRFAKTPSKLPIVLSREEIEKIINSISIDAFKENFSLKVSQLQTKLINANSKASQYLGLCQVRENIINKERERIKELEATIKTLTRINEEGK
jgi:site-specific recombinase XerD